ncbi:MAG: tetratricopeptide repeat protein [Proteobacteria bacterium]|nr:tetratricopeptide repeat protein [Pseudomonadota bacterium]
MIKPDTASVRASLERAMALHRQGRLAEAERAYRSILVVHPACFDALHYLGLLDLQRGQHESAVRYIGEALRIEPKSPAALNNLGNALRALGRREEALGSYDKALAIRPRYLEALNGKGNTLQQLMRFEDAVAAYDRALASEPKSAEILNNRGNALQKLKRYDDAIASYDRALALRPDFIMAIANRGDALRNFGRYQEALGTYDKALAIGSSYADTAAARESAGSSPPLVDQRRVLHPRPEHAGALFGRGAALQGLGRYAEALVSYGQALSVKPEYPDALNNCGVVLLELGRFEDALHTYDKLLAVDPAYVDAIFNRGVTLEALEQYAAAVAAYQQVLAINPDHHEARYNEALCLLRNGEWARGWDGFKVRWQWAGLAPGGGRYPGPEWDGAYLDGTLLVWSEQGIGDQILYSSMFEQLRKSARDLIVEVPAKLVALFRRSFDGMTIIAQGESGYAGRFDAHIPLGSIGRYLRRGWQDFVRREGGYLRADAALAASLRNRLAGDGRLLVGLAWKSKNASLGKYKSMELSAYAPLLKLPDLQFVDLQYGDVRGEIEQVAATTGIRIEQVGEIDNYEDIDGLAALISACDAVVTVSNTTAHLAGALGKPVYVLLPRGRGLLWYWHADRIDSPWYSSAKLYRQSASEEWDIVIQRVVADLAAVSP